MQLSFREFQALLIKHGFDMPKFGADGYWGNETAEAVKRWAGSAERLSLESSPDPVPAPVPRERVIPLEWLPKAKMKIIINHWTAGTHWASDYEKTRYHILGQGDGSVVRGIHSIAENQKTGGGAQHTRAANTGAIGYSLCASAGAVEIPYDPGIYPVTKIQWEVMARANAEMCIHYDIPVTRKTVLSHCEVPKELGIWQRNKWDIAQVPFYTETWTALGDKFRDEVRAAL